MKFFKPLLVASLTIFSLGTTFAQGNYSVRFANKQADCNQGIVYVDIEIKSADNAINLTEQNYRFSFNTDAVSNPRIAEELTISGMTGTSIYSAHTLKGSVSNIVSYNVELAGGKGYELPTQWVGVGRLAFDIMDETRCMNLTWNDESTFPSTFVGQMVDNSREKSSSSVLEDLNDCDFCDIATDDIIEPLMDKAGLEVFPNPAIGDEDVSVTYLAAADSDASIIVMDVNGKVVMSQQITLAEGMNNLTLTHQKLQTGTYFVQIRTNNERTETKKFVKFAK